MADGEILIKKLSYNFEIEVVTGLAIGGSSKGISIGEVDRPVIRDGRGKIYIPGSSLKGKLRSLLVRVDEDSELIKKYFGQEPESNEIIKGRMIFRDLYPEGDNITTEVKTEVRVDPISGKGEHPREIERVPPGVKFNGEIIIDIYDEKEKEEAVNLLNKAFDLLENDYLGGCGTRGYGRVKVHKGTVKEVWSKGQEK